MPQRLKKAIHALTNTMQVVLSAIEEEEFELALKSTRRAVNQLDGIRELIGMLQASTERRD